MAMDYVRRVLLDWLLGQGVLEWADGFLLEDEGQMPRFPAIER